MNYFSVVFGETGFRLLWNLSACIQMCAKNCTKIDEFVEIFTEPLVFLWKSGILLVYLGENSPFPAAISHIE